MVHKNSIKIKNYAYEFLKRPIKKTPNSNMKNNYFDSNRAHNPCSYARLWAFLIDA